MRYFRVLPGWMQKCVHFGEGQQDSDLPAISIHTFYNWAALIRLPQLDAHQETLLQHLPPIPIKTFRYADISEVSYNIHIFSETMRSLVAQSENAALLRFFPMQVFLLTEEAATASELPFYAVQYAAPLWIPCLKWVPAYKHKELRLPPSELVGGSFRKAVYDTGNALLFVNRELLRDVPFCRVSNEYNESLIVREDVLDSWLRAGVEGFDFEEVLMD